MLRNLPQILFPLVTRLSPFSTRLRGRIALAFQSLPLTDPQILERTDFAREDWCVESHQAMDLCFPEYLCDVVCFLRTYWCELVSKLLYSSLKIEINVGGSTS